MPVTLRVDQVREEPRTYEGTLDAEELDLAVDGLRGFQPLAYRLRANLAGPELVILGSLHMAFEAECVKCTAFTPESVDIPHFVRSFSLEEVSEVLDLTPELREELLLTFPTFPQCSAACAGLCPVCGNNLNHKQCDCAPSSADDRWGALDSLTLGDEPGS